MLSIPDSFIAAADEVGHLRNWLTEARETIGVPKLAPHGHSTPREPVWTLDLVMHRLRGTKPPTYGPWVEEQRTRHPEPGDDGLQQPSYDYYITVRKTSEGKDIAWLSRGLWWPRIPLDAGEVETSHTPNPSFPDDPVVTKLAWKWSAAGRWGYANPKAEAVRIVNEVLAASGYLPHPACQRCERPCPSPHDYNVCVLCLDNDID